MFKAKDSSCLMVFKFVALSACLTLAACGGSGSSDNSSGGNTAGGDNSSGSNTGGGGNDTNQNAQTVSFTVTPADKSTDISVIKPEIKIVFNQPVINAVLPNQPKYSGTILLKGSKYDFKRKNDPSNKQEYIFEPEAYRLKGGKTYTISVDTSRILDENGKPIGTDVKEFTFTTKKDLRFTALVGENDALVNMLTDVKDDAELYSYPGTSCTVAEVENCADSKKILLNGQPQANTTHTLTSPASYVLKEEGELTLKSKISGMPFEARTGIQASVFKDKMWLVSGFLKDTVWSSNDGAHWDKEPNTTDYFKSRADAQTVVFKDKLWLIGGRGYSLETIDGGSSLDRNDVWSSEDGKTWTEVTRNAQFSKRDHHQVVVHDGKMWVIGGEDDHRLNDVWSSSDGITWTQVTSNAQFSKRKDHKVVVHDGKMWVIGGYDNTGENYVVNDVWSSADGATWTKELDNKASPAPADNQFPQRHSHEVVKFNNKFWLIGGYGLNPFNDVWSSSDLKTWTKVIDDDLSTTTRFGAVSEHQVLVFKDKLWVIGGGSGEEQSNDVWSSDDGIKWRKSATGVITR